eukprot:3862364-Amphidinium_carterae.1
MSRMWMCQEAEKQNHGPTAMSTPTEPLRTLSRSLCRHQAKRCGDSTVRCINVRWGSSRAIQCQLDVKCWLRACDRIAAM